MTSLYTRFLHLENHLHHRLVQHSITALRIAVGAVFLGFGILKYFPGVSPAQNLTEATTHILFLGLVPGDVAIVMIATLECTIGILLLANRGMRVAVWLLATEFVGILSPRSVEVRTTKTCCASASSSTTAKGDQRRWFRALWTRA